MDPQFMVRFLTEDILNIPQSNLKFYENKGVEHTAWREVNDFLITPG